MPWLMVVLLIVLFAGGLFGYDQGVISGALRGMTRAFSLSQLLVEVVTSWVTLGALFGAVAGGELADRLGRRPTVLIAAATFTLGAVIQASAPDTILLLLGRLVVGGGVGIAAVAAPLYAAELAPTGARGRFVSAYQLAIAIGIFLAYLADGWLSRTNAWRLMLGMSVIPGSLLFLAASMAPESPRWLMKMHRRGDAARQLRKVRPGPEVEPQLDAIETALGQETRQVSWAELFRRRWRRPLMIGIGLAVFQQITGINAIIYYADQIFEHAGFLSASSQTTLTTWAIGGVNVLATLIAIAFVDRVGRRRLLLVGLAGMATSLIVVGAAFRFVGAPAAHAAAPAGSSSAGIVTLVALVGFILCFAFSMGPVVWTVINEIFPGHIRGRAVAVATAVNWASAFLVSQLFLSVVGVIGDGMTFWMFALFCAVGWGWIYRVLPETRGASLEQIERIWQAPAGC